MAENKIVGYKKIFGFVLPDWVDEGTIRMLVTLLLSAVAMLFVLIFVIWPKFSTISEMKATLRKNEEALSQLKDSKSGFDKLNEQIPESVQKTVLSAIPTSYSPENAIFLLRKIGSETPGLSIVSYRLPSGVLYDTTSPNTGKASSNDKEIVSFVKYPIQLTVMAPVESLLIFINKIETSLPIGVVSDLGMQEVTKLAKSTVNNSIQMDLEVTYYQAQLKQVDISKISQISTEDLALVSKIAGFSQIRSAVGTGTGIAPVATGSSGSLFGF